LAGIENQTYFHEVEMKQSSQKKQFVVCVTNEGYQASLEVRKIYEVVADESAGEHGLVLVIDESGEDYLYPEAYFIAIDLPQSAEKALMIATRDGRRTV
jgi:hypothetical protein